MDDALALAAKVRAGETTATELLDEALARAEAARALNALATVEAERARERIREGLPEGPFTGVPFLLKDLGAEARDFPSHLGSELFRGTTYGYDSAIYERLRNAGLVTWGRTTAPELGIGIATEAAVYGGPTRNPWNLAHTPGGSSGGAAALVAADVVPAAHGSDGGGSVRVPASCCGLFGFKATRARLPDGPASGEGWAGMAIDGFLTWTVRDAAALLDACAGPDLGAPYHAPPMHETFAQAAERDPETPLRVAFCDTTFDGDPVHPACATAAREAASLLEALGHRVEPARPRVDNLAMMEAWTRIVACGTAAAVDARLAALGRPLRDGDVEPVVRSALELAARTSGARYVADLDAIHAFGRAMAAFFVDHDVLLTPTLAVPPPPVGALDHSRADYWDYRLGPTGVFAASPFCAAFNASGQPAASLPLGMDEGLPIGVHLAGPFGRDDLLMRLCGQVERAAPWHGRRPPEPPLPEDRTWT